GASETSRTFALAHTGALAGSAQAFDAYAAAAGIVRLVSIEDAIEAGRVFGPRPPPRGAQNAPGANSGGPRNPTPQTPHPWRPPRAPRPRPPAARRQQAPDQPHTTTPPDTKRTPAARQYVACFDTLVNAPEVDIVLAAEELPRDDGAERRVANLRSLEEVAQR